MANIRDRCIAVCERHGLTRLPSTTRMKYVKFELPDGRLVALGRSGAVRMGTCVSQSRSWDYSREQIASEKLDELIVQLKAKHPAQAASGVPMQPETGPRWGTRERDGLAGCTVSEERDWVWVAFHDKPPADVRQLLKDAGFRWGKTRRAWYKKSPGVPAFLKPETMDVALNHDGDGDVGEAGTELKDHWVGSAVTTRDVPIEVPDPLKRKWQRIKNGEHMVTNDEEMDILCAHFKDEDTDDAKLFFAVATKPNPDRVGVKDAYLAYLKCTTCGKESEPWQVNVVDGYPYCDEHYAPAYQLARFRRAIEDQTASVLHMTEWDWNVALSTLDEDEVNAFIDWVGAQHDLPLLTQAFFSAARRAAYDPDHPPYAWFSQDSGCDPTEVMIGEELLDVKAGFVYRGLALVPGTLYRWTLVSVECTGLPCDDPPQAVPALDFKLEQDHAVALFKAVRAEYARMLDAMLNAGRAGTCGVDYADAEDFPLSWSTQNRLIARALRKVLRTDHDFFPVAGEAPPHEPVVTQLHEPVVAANGASVAVLLRLREALTSHMERTQV